MVNSHGPSSGDSAPHLSLGRHPALVGLWFRFVLKPKQQLRGPLPSFQSRLPARVSLTSGFPSGPCLGPFQGKVDGGEWECNLRSPLAQSLPRWGSCHRLVQRPRAPPRQPPPADSSLPSASPVQDTSHFGTKTERGVQSTLYHPLLSLPLFPSPSQAAWGRRSRFPLCLFWGSSTPYLPYTLMVARGREDDFRNAKHTVFLFSKHYL